MKVFYLLYIYSDIVQLHLIQPKRNVVFLHYKSSLDILYEVDTHLLSFVTNFLKFLNLVSRRLLGQHHNHNDLLEIVQGKREVKGGKGGTEETRKPRRSTERKTKEYDKKKQSKKW
jgi:hypothetical protein